MSASSVSQRAPRPGAGVRNFLTWNGVVLASTLCVAGPVASFAYPEAPIRVAAAEQVEPPPVVEDKPIAYRDVEVTIDEPGTQLFGLETEPVGIGDLHEKWHHVVAAMAHDFAVVDRCRSGGACPAAASRLLDISAEGAGRSGRARIGLINRATNLAISPVSDERQWGTADHWSDPFETLLSYRGDCEDYAIVKYAALLEAGVARNDLKVVILRKFFPNQHHAVAAARLNGEWLILDNRTSTLVRDTDLTRAIPIFVLDHDGVRRFKSAHRHRWMAGRSRRNSA